MVIPSTGHQPNFVFVTPTGVFPTHLLGWAFTEKTGQARPILFPAPPDGAVILYQVVDQIFGSRKWTDLNTGKTWDSPGEVQGEL